MNGERKYLLSVGMPESVARKKEIFRPSSVGVIIHTGELEVTRNRRSFEPDELERLRLIFESANREDLMP